MSEAIGGYFSLELPYVKEYFLDGIRLNTGRNCLEFILHARKFNKVYIPYYTCDVILEPFKKLGIQYEYYHLDIHLEIRDNLDLRKGEALLYTNYYGLKQRYIEYLAKKFGSKLIVDNTQAFYARPIRGIDSFNSCRKFFGVPDGAYVFTDVSSAENFDQDTSCQRMTSLIKRIDKSPEEGFADFHKEGDMLCDQPIRMMSKFTHRMMISIDYAKIAEKRRENYMQLHKTLSDTNDLTFFLEDDTVPMVYPYLVKREGLREFLIKNRIFVARYWPNVLDWTNIDDLEYQIANHLLPLPIDQRYGKNDMQRIIDVIESYD